MKKAQGLPINVIIIIAICLIVFVILIFVFRNILGKETDVVYAQIKGTDDCDEDGIVNFLDPCPCHETESANCIKDYTKCPSCKT